jgi:hypothetical protein
MLPSIFRLIDAVAQSISNSTSRNNQADETNKKIAGSTKALAYFAGLSFITRAVSAQAGSYPAASK